MRSIVILFALVFLGACGRHPAAPDLTPRVAGDYRGTLSWDVSAHGGFAPQRVTIRVTQEGARLDLGGTMHFPLQPAELPQVQCRLNVDGTAACSPGTGVDKVCGRMDLSQREARFDQGLLVYDSVVLTESCGTWRLGGTLSR